MPRRKEINDAAILDEMIEALRGKISECSDPEEWLKLNDRLLKALALKGRRGKNRGFNLGNK